MRSLAWMALLTIVVAGCISPGQEGLVVEPAAQPDAPDGRVFFHRGDGTAIPAPAEAVAPVVNGTTLEWNGAEPSLGVTSNGWIFFVAMEKVLRSKDGGQTWEVVSTTLSSPTTLDPYLYVDADTDRVFSDQLYVGCSWLSYSDDYGESGVTNPVACGLPVNDHQKIATGKNRGLLPTVGYEKVVYYAYNAIAAGSRVSMSYDGGLTWPTNTQTVSPSQASCNGGLHGNLVAAPDGMVYIPKRHCEGFLLARSADSGLTWTTKPVGADAGGSPCRKNADLGIDREGGLYGAWPGKDNRLYLSASTDQGETWRATSLVASPPEVNMTTMPALVAGDPGRIAVAYYGTSDGARGPDEVDPAAQWHLYVTYSLDALEETPTFVTVRASADPVQVGPISTNSGCDAPAGSRNLLDFIDAQLDAHGRLFVAYADGCVGPCVDEPTMESSRARKGAVAITQEGPSLFADAGNLTGPYQP